MLWLYIIAFEAQLMDVLGYIGACKYVTPPGAWEPWYDRLLAARGVVGVYGFLPPMLFSLGYIFFCQQWGLRKMFFVSLALDSRSHWQLVNTSVLFWELCSHNAEHVEPRNVTIKYAEIQ